MIIVFLKYNMESRLTINENIILHRFYQMREEKFFESLFLYITVDNWDEESKWWNEWRHFYKILYDHVSFLANRSQWYFDFGEVGGFFHSHLIPLQASIVCHFDHSILMPIFLEFIKSLTILILCRQIATLLLSFSTRLVSKRVRLESEVNQAAMSEACAIILG